MDVNYTYCSQAGALVGNLAFVWAAWALRRHGPLLSWLLLVACGASTLWHAVGTRPLLYLDMAATAAVAVVLIFSSLRDHHGLSAPRAMAATAGLLGVSVLADVVRPDLLPLDGILLLPGLIYILCTGVLLRLREDPKQRGVLAAGALFGLGLAMRSLDLALCQAVPFGTHLLWHVLAAAGAVTLAKATDGTRRMQSGQDRQK